MSRHTFSRRAHRRKRTGGRLYRLHEEEGDKPRDDALTQRQLLRRLARVRRLMRENHLPSHGRRDAWRSEGRHSPKAQRTLHNRLFSARLRASRRRKHRPLGRKRDTR